MRRGAGIGVGEASDPGDIAGQFDDPLVVDVVQHKIEVSAPGAIALGDRCSQPYIWVETAEIQSGRFPWRPQIEPIRPPWLFINVGLRRPAANRPVCPVTLRP